MTPSLTFQWPLSPSGTFQPARSWPLKSDVKPSGTSSCAAARPRPAPSASRAARNAIGLSRCIVQSPRRTDDAAIQCMVRNVLRSSRDCKLELEKSDLAALLSRASPRGPDRACPDDARPSRLLVDSQPG